MKVKICGINKTEFAVWANDLGADYLGLLVGITHQAEDKLSDSKALKIINDSGINRDKFVMVTHLLDADSIIKKIKFLNIKVVQLHDKISIKEIKAIRKSIHDLFIIKAVHIINREQSVAYAHYMEKYADALLLDSRTETRLGGTGIPHDWSISQEICATSKIPVFLAGGLNCSNLQTAINTVKPYGVDVNSGVEYENGDKNINLIKSFIQIAKHANI